MVMACTFYLGLLACDVLFAMLMTELGSNKLAHKFAAQIVHTFLAKDVHDNFTTYIKFARATLTWRQVMQTMQSQSWRLMKQFLRNALWVKKMSTPRHLEHEIQDTDTFEQTCLEIDIMLWIDSMLFNQVLGTYIHCN